MKTPSIPDVTEKSRRVARGSMRRMVRAIEKRIDVKIICPVLDAMDDEEYANYVTDCQNGYGHLWRK